MLTSTLRGLLFRLSRLRGFWSARSRLQRLAHAFRAWSFRIRFYSREERSNVSFLLLVVRMTLLPVLLATLVAGILQEIGPRSETFLESLLPPASLSAPKPESYIDFLSTVAGIGGVLIGLYYAGIMTVASSVYSDMPTSVRNLLAHERAGNVYIRFLAFLTTLALLLIAFNLVGLEPSKLSVGVVALLSAFAVFAVMKLGQQAFYLFDPTVLSRPLFHKLLQQIRRVSAGGYGWANPSFQAHAHSRARESADSLVALASLPSGASGASQESKAEVAADMLRFLALYEQELSRVPSESRWFGQRFEYKDWYLTSDTEVHTARHTGTMLSPTPKPDTSWLEDMLLASATQRLEADLKAGDYRAAARLLGTAERFIGTLARGLRSNEALDSVEALAKPVFDHIVGLDTPSTETQRWLVALADSVGQLLISALAALAESCNGLSLQATEKRLRAIDWASSESIYRQGFPRCMLESLEWIQPLLRFERQVEGRIVSPFWYRRELMIRPLADALVEQLDTVTVRATRMFTSWRQSFMDSNSLWCAAGVQSRYWEYLSKLDSHHETVLQTWKSLSKEKRIDGLAWKPLDEDNEANQLDDSRKAALVESAKLGAVLAFVERPADFPDYGGQFLDQAGDGIFRGLLKADTDLVEAGFAAYFAGILRIFDSLRPKEGEMNHRTETELLLASAPVMDLLDLSGYVLLLSQLHQAPKLWRPVKDLWDSYLNADDEKRIGFLAAIIRLTDARFHVPHRGVLRTGWQQEIAHLMKSVARRHVMATHSVPVPLILHDSPLVRVFARDDLGPHSDGIDVFVGLYLMERDDASDIEFGFRRSQLPDQIRRQEEWYAQHQGDADETD